MAKTEIILGEAGGGITATYGNDTFPQNTTKHIDCGFEPKHIIMYFIYNNSSPIVFDVDVDANEVYRAYGSSRVHYEYLSASSFSVDASGFSYTSPYPNGTFYYLASKS